MRIYENLSGGMESRKLSSICLDVSPDNEMLVNVAFFVTKSDIGIVHFTVTPDDVKLFQAMFDSAEQFRKGE